MKGSKGIAIGFMIVALVAVSIFSVSHAAQTQPPPTAAPPTATGKPSQAAPALPDLIVERVWLDKEGSINFQLKNASQAKIPDREHRQGMVRVTYGKEHADFSFRKTLKKRPAVDPTGLLKKPGGVVQYNTQIRVQERLTVAVVVDSTKRIAEANEQNNQAVLLGLAALKDLRKETAKEAKPVPPLETRREITQGEGLRTLEDEGPGRGAGGDLDLEIVDFHIFQGPRTADRTWGDTAHYTYNGGGEHEDIKFLVEVLNHGPGNFEGSLIITVRSGSAQVSDTTSVINIPSGWVRPYEVVLHQSDLIEQGDLSAGRHKFFAQIRPFPDDANRENNISPDRVTLYLLPAGRAIPKRTFSLTSETALTGSVERGGRVRRDLEASSCGPTRAFISFDLLMAQDEIREWIRDGWSGFEVENASLEIEQNGISVDLTEDQPLRLDTTGTRMWCVISNSADLQSGHGHVGSILLDLLDYGASLTSSAYNADMITNLLTFRSACTRHSFAPFDSYVRFQLERGLSKIQFRLRLSDEGKEVNNDCISAWFDMPCTLKFTISAKE